MFRACLLATALTTAAMAQTPSVQSLLLGLEAHYTQTTDIKARVQLTEQKAQQGTKTLDMVYYRRDSDKSFLIVMTAPENEKGNGYLRMADNFWMYRRNTRTFQHINRDESIGGSDAHGDDFENRKLTEMYGPALDSAGKENVTDEMLGQVPAWRFEVKAKVKDVSYPKKIYWIQKTTGLVLKEQSYSSSGTLMQTAYYFKYTAIHGKYVPVKQLFVDEFEKGNKTEVALSELSDEKLKEEIFTKAYLENLSK